MKWIKLRGALKHIGQINEGEGVTAFLMLGYSFLVMASYSIIKPITRSKFIEGFGAEDIPYIQLAAGVLIGGIMLGYSWLMARLPRRWGLPIIQGAIVGLILGFWFLFRLEKDWVSVGFYFAGLILGLLLISQFWTVANLIYDVRQAKRLFGFIGAGAPLGGIVGSLITTLLVYKIGSSNLLLVSAVFMSAGIFVVIAIIVREPPGDRAAAVHKEDAPSPWQAMELLRNSKHLQLIALVMGFAAIGDAIIEQQLNMAAEASIGEEGAIAGFLAGLQALTSSFSFLIQFLLISRIHQFLGIGLALIILPISLGSTAMIMLLNAALWAPAMARVVDQSLRYTVDKTSREILFMPLPGDIKFRAKTFVDVSVERFSKGLAAVLILILIKPWGLDLDWQQLGYASLTIMVLWILAALRAKRGYLEAFHRSIEARTIKPSDQPMAAADMSTVDTLVKELSLDDERRVIYAIDLLEALDKKNLITPLILYHESAAVRIRALSLLSSLSPVMANEWLPSIRRLLTDPDTEVRAAAVGALANMSDIDSTELVRPYLSDRHPRIAMTAAMILTRSNNPRDKEDAEKVLKYFGAISFSSQTEKRRELAAVLGHIPDERFYRLLIPLLADSSLEVAQEALQSVRRIGGPDFMFVPSLVSMLRHPWLKASVRELLLGYGREVLRPLGHFLGDTEEDASIRRQIPATVARIPCQEAADILMNSLEDPDGHVRFEALAGLERLRRQEGLVFRREPLEQQILQECERQIYYEGYYLRFFGSGKPLGDCLLARALREKTLRGMDRIFRLLGLIFPWKDMAAARWSIESGKSSRAKALEYLDNLLPAGLRRRVIPVLEQSQVYDNPTHFNKTQATGGHDFERSLFGLIRDRDPVISASAIHVIGDRRLEHHSTFLEQVLASQDTYDRCVLEAARWALWRLGQPKEKIHAPWQQQLPAVEIAWRLNRFPLFASVSVDELFRVAMSGRQINHDEGEVICRAGSPMDEYLFLMEGKVFHQARLAPEKEIAAPVPVNFEEVLMGTAMDKPVRASSSCISFSLASDKFRSLVSENTGLIEGFLRMLCVHASSEIADPIVRGKRPSIAEANLPLKPTDKILLFEAYPVFSSLSREELMGVVGIASEMRFAEGSELFGEMAPPALYTIVSGLVVVETADEKFPVSASDGDAIGIYQMLSGIPLASRAFCASDSLILRVDRGDFLDLLLLRPELTRQILGSLFSSSHS